MYKTPDVYIEEIAKLPPSVAPVSTAIPAFLGYTEKASNDGNDLTKKPTRISTLLEYETYFGGPKSVEFEVNADADNNITNLELKEALNHLLYHNLDIYFKNGGGPCYIVSLGNYSATASENDFVEGLTALEQEDEPTLIVLTEAAQLFAGSEDTGKYYSIAQTALLQCNKLKDRFVILDVLEGDADGSKFRTGIGTNYLKYGAAYYPSIETTLTYDYAETGVAITQEEQEATTLDAIATSNTGLYNTIKTKLAQQRITLLPSSAIAGIYAATDRDRGVWQAPANISLSSVVEPTVKITSATQENLNVDATSGKSINAIRSFTGKGTLVWGARTLAGNDNEWRYINVRRLFNLIEESTQKASAFAVFEANNTSTWLKVKAMIESFLYQLWQQGALAGATSEEAYYVNVGLGKTMTPQDVLEGRMNVEIGVAAVRPAEFIILKFSHKLQEAA